MVQSQLISKYMDHFFATCDILRIETKTTTTLACRLCSEVKNDILRLYPRTRQHCFILLLGLHMFS